MSTAPAEQPATAPPAERAAPLGRPGLLPVVLLAAAGFLAYHNSFAGVFLFDDLDSILHNPHIRQMSPPWQSFFSDARALVTWSLSANYALGGYKVWGYHAVNLAVHVLAALSLFGVVRRTLL